MKNIREPAANPKKLKPLEVTLYDAVMASAAAPSYFPCHDFSAFDPNAERWRTVHGIDGSIFDNPCISWHGAIKPHVPQGRQPVMIALGTGAANRAIHKDEWNRFGSLGVVDPANDLPLINIFFQAPESALREVFAEEMGNHLFSFNRSLFEPSSMGELPSNQIDDASDEQLRRLERFAHIIIEENRKQFDDLCHLLVKNRDRLHKEQHDFMSTLKRTVHVLSGGTLSSPTKTPEDA